jgi:hypothetical protein
MIDPFAICHYGAYYSADGNPPYYCRECIKNLIEKPFNSEKEVQDHMVRDHRHKVGFGLFDAGPKYGFWYYDPREVSEQT